MKPISNLQRISILLFAAALCLSFRAPAHSQTAKALMQGNPPANSVWVDSLFDKDPDAAGGATLRQTHNGDPIIINKMIYRHGFAMYGEGFLGVELTGAATKFMAMAAIEDNIRGNHAIIYQVWLDGKKAAETTPMQTGDKPQLISVDTTGAKRMYLVTVSATPGVNAARINWGGALIVLDPNAKTKPAPYSLDDKSVSIAHVDSPKPAIHGPRVVGSTPGYAFIFKIPATGKDPLKFAAKNLPAGLTLNPKTGIITGSIKKDGKYAVRLTVSGPRGKSTRKLTIIAGKDKLARTPPMGWNSWNVWAASVNGEKVRAAADAMLSSGLAAHGFQYVNIDEGWQQGRGPDGIVIPDKKMPDIKSIADYVHSKGLRLGIYSSPGPFTCGDIYEGSYKHEFQDALTYAKWDVDYLKYDWCTYETVAKDHSLSELQKPYALMRSALDAAPRDIVYSFCQYGMGDVCEWGEKTGGNLWRTTDDINDSWGSMSGIAFTQDGHDKFAGPGHWNDPDMLVVGQVGWGPKIRKTRLTKTEQITHITMWSMLAAPLLIGADMTRLDSFTIDLLTNDEVLDVDQDPLGKQARRVATQQQRYEVWARPLHDGTYAVALINRHFEKGKVTLNFSDIALKGIQPIRDLWQHKNLGSFKNQFTTEVPAHGAVMLKIGKPKKNDWD